MKVVDGLCPYCDIAIKEKPSSNSKQINCTNCGRLLTLPSIFTDNDGKSSQLLTVELGLCCSFLVGLGLASGSVWLLISFIFLGTIVMVLFWTQEGGNLVPEVFRLRAIGTSERLKLFPFELYLIGGWFLLLFLNTVGAERSAGFLYCFIMLAAGWMSIQANRLYRESKVRSLKISLLDIPLFLRILKDPSTAFSRQRQEKIAGESYSETHFSMAEAEKVKKDQLKAENVAELSRLQDICRAERSKWETDIDERYNKWLNDEYSRLQTEESGKK